MSNKSFSTGVAFVDALLDGGHRRKTMYGLLGPIGIGKSHLADQLAGEGARLLEQNNMPGKWVLVDLENSWQLVAFRLISLLSGLSREEVGRVLSSRNDATGRCREAVALIHRRIAWFTPDVVRSLLHAKHPENTLAELVKTIAAETPIAGLIVDHSSMFKTGGDVTRAMNAFQISRRVLDFVEACGNLAERYDCPVWIVHQQNTAANEKHPLAAQNHRSASISKRWSDRMNYCLVLGTHDRATHCFTIRCTKAPGIPGHPQPILLRIDSDVARLIAVDDDEASIDMEAFQIRETPSRIEIDAEDLIRLEHLCKTSSHR